MNTINVLIVVDVEGALSSNDLQGNVYLIDTNKHDGSSSEGTAELYTACQSTNLGGDTISWAVTPINPANNVTIYQFTGQMIDGRYLIPSGPNNDGSWSGALQANLESQDIQYSVVLEFDGQKTMSFDPFLKVNQ